MAYPSAREHSNDESESPRRREAIPTHDGNHCHVSDRLHGGRLLAFQ